MRESYLIHNDFGKTLYRQVRDLPVCDYHCHLSPKEIYEDIPFEGIGKLWLEGDHYKWRLMRAFGTDEDKITGSAGWDEKFDAYAAALECAPGNPLYHWSAMELDRYFGITEPLTARNAPQIRAAADAKIAAEKISPRKLILDSGVKYIATTDELCDDLIWHEKIAADPAFPVKVTPSFRTDRLLMINAPGYGDYLDRLSGVCGYPIQNLSDLERAVADRLDFFIARGCKFTDVGIPYFPRLMRDRPAAGRALASVIAGKGADEPDFMAFLDHMMRFCAGLYASRGLVMQLHLAVARNVNSRLYARCGRDAGGDCAGDVVTVSALTRFLDAVNSDSPSGLPETVIYCLNPAMIPAAASVAGSYPKVRMGAAWWFCDHRRGIREQLETVAEYGHLGRFPGMLTDSRSFLSYARHDYFRRILCDLLGEWVESGECTPESAGKCAMAICYGNIARLTGIE